MREREMEQRPKQKEAAADTALHGDVLDAIVSRVSPLDLLPASRVSKAWRAAVLSSPRRPPPWFILHHLGRRQVAAAFDPLSRAWRSLPFAPSYPSHRQGPQPQQVSSYMLSPGGGTRLCVLSVSALALATDPFGASWRQLEPPRYSRTDPVVAVVGTRVVVAGGASDLEDGENAVEVFDGGASGAWVSCEPMPEAFRWSESISSAAVGRRLYVLEKQSPFTLSWFDVESRRWGPARGVRVPDPTVRHAAIGFANGRLLLAGAGGIGTGFGWRAESVRLWAVDEESLQVEEEVGSMPRAMVEELVGDGGWGLSSLGFLSEGRFAYVYNPSYPKDLFLCELEEGGGCRWESVPRPACMEERPTHRVVVGCCQVGVEDLMMGKDRTV
nr:PREDICTED: F-box/kelch-repeat protein At1g23390-like [Musa acuminata subsp. malaccensis]